MSRYHSELNKLDWVWTATRLRQCGLFLWLSLLWLSQAAVVQAQQSLLPALSSSTPIDSELTASGLSASGVGSLGASAAADPSYILGPGDKLYLGFFNVPEYDGE